MSKKKEHVPPDESNGRAVVDDGVLREPSPKPALRVAPAPENDDEAEKFGPDDLVIAPTLSVEIQGLLLKHPHLRKRFDGGGKCGSVKNPTPDDYDLEFTKMLVRKGITNLNELATALWHRPTSGAQANGREYVLNLVRDVVDVARAAEEQESLDFVVTMLRIFNSAEPLYEFTIEGTTFVVPHKDLLKPSAFLSRFVAALSRVPAGIPEDKRQADWYDIVGRWLEGAEFQSLGDDADPRAELRNALLDILDALPDGQICADLKLNRCVRDAERGLAFVTVPALKLFLKSRGVDAARGADVALELTRLRGHWGEHTVDSSGAKAKCWALPLLANLVDGGDGISSTPDDADVGPELRAQDATQLCEERAERQPALADEREPALPPAAFSATTSSGGEQ